MTSILFSRSRRTASIRSGRAGGLAGKLAVFDHLGARNGSSSIDKLSTAATETAEPLHVCTQGDFGHGAFAPPSP